MRKIYRTIASALIFSKDNKLLMGKKDPNGGGVYPDCRHIPGGGVDQGETLKDALIREVKEEIGLDISNHEIIPLPYNDFGTAKKILKKTGEEVICNMKFNRFKIIIEKKASEIELILGDDLVEINWFDLEELVNVKQVPGGKEFFQKMEYIKQI